MQHTRVRDHGATDLDQVSQIILTYAFILSRQKAAPETTFTALFQHGLEVRRVEIDLEILPSKEVGILLQTIKEFLQSSTVSTLQQQDLNASQDLGEGRVIKITRHNDYWNLETDLQQSHAEDFNESFDHIYSQAASLQQAATVSQVSTTTGNDIRWILENASHPIPPANQTSAVAVFKQAARQKPEKVAVEAWDGVWTYSELDEQSTKLALRLIRNGVQPVTIIPLFFQFSKWVPVSILAVWKAGAAWVFLDPNYPLSRLRALCKRVRASIVVTQATAQPQLLKLDIPMLLAEEGEDKRNGHETEQRALENLALPQNPSYLIFTSGSTGEPKAVVHSHLALCSGVLYQAQNLGISRETRTLQNCPLIFAGAIAEILFTLLAGGCLCVPREEERLQNLAGCATQLQTNFLILASSSAAVRDPEDFPPGHRVLIGAEPLSAHTAEKWSALHECCNAYGSSETNTVATCCSFADGMTHRSVGKGAAHRYWIVDAANCNALVPPGWLGEIVVESHALASGYMGNEEATGKAFPTIPEWRAALDVHDQLPARFYRTGDLGRFAPDGKLEVHGRTDVLQVKLRGQRIELGEIEAACLDGLQETMPLVAELILPKGQERPSIAVFFVAPHLVQDLSASLLAEHVSMTEEQEKQLGRVKERLRGSWADSLPEYMAPSYVVPLAELPRTATGKLDRRRLRIWSSEYQARELTVFATSSTTGSNRPLKGEPELRLRDAIAKVLKIPLDSISASSVFTVLGGDSLAAIQLSHELKLLGLDIAPSEIIQSENLASLAARLETVTTTNDPQEHVTNFEDDWIKKSIDRDALLRGLNIAADNVTDVLLTTDSQSRSIELGTGPENCFVFHFVLKLEVGLDLARLQSALQRLVDRHDTLRTLFTRKEGRILQIILRHLPCPLDIQDLNEESSVDHRISEIVQSRIELDQVPTQFWLLSQNDRPAALVLRLSHAQFDGISMHLLWDSLAECYSQTNPEPAPAFSTYARTVLHKDNVSELAYFKDLLREVPFTDLVRRPRSGQLPQNRSLHRRLILRPVPGFTMAHLFEAAWGYVCAKSSNARASVFDTIVSGRQVELPADFNIGRLVGACLNDVPVVVRFSKNQSVRQLLGHIRDQHNASAKHETLGFRKILGECIPADWPRDARMTSSVQYRGFEGEDKTRIGNTQCTLSLFERSMDLEDLTVLVTPMRKDGAMEFEVKFLYSDEVVKEAQAEGWFEELIRCVTALGDDDVLQRGVDEVFGPLES